MIIIRAITKKEYDSDVIVVGAGPAGSSAANYLATSGYNVILIDKLDFPRDKVCGDFVSPVAQFELARLGITQTTEFRCSNKVSQASIYLDGEKLVSKVTPKFQGLPRYGRVIPRVILDKLLLDSACRQGATFMGGFRAVDIQVRPESVELFLEGACGKSTLKARLVIGADGSNSTISRIVRGHPPFTADRIIAIRGYFKGVAGSANEADLHFNNESFPGYCWVFPTAVGEANVGVGTVLDTIPSGSRLKELLYHLIRNDAALNKRLRNAKLIGHLGAWPLTTYNPNQALVRNRVMLVGDAAGLVNPLNGEGIQNALLSGRWASEAAISCLNANDLSVEALATYQNKVERELRYGMSLASLIVQLIRNRSFNHLWLQSMKIMAERSRLDQSYANIVGGILMGTVPQNEATSLEVVRGTIEQFMSTNGLVEAIRDPVTLVRASLETLQMTLDASVQATQNPSAFIDWAVRSVNSAINVAVASASHYEAADQETSN